MGTLTMMICDECGKKVQKFVEIEHRVYCGRDCYLMACKRRFDELWFHALHVHDTPPAQKPKVIVSNIA